MESNLPFYQSSRYNTFGYVAYDTNIEKIQIVTLLPLPSSVLEYANISHVDLAETEEHIDMVPLEHGFREFFSVDPVFFSEREMHSDLAFVEIDVR